MTATPGFARAERAFLAALKLPRAERRAYLERELAADPDALPVALALLAGDAEEDDGFLASPPLVEMAEALEGAAPERIGPFAIEGEAGRGGMGVVYRARQTSPVERTVALKVIRRGMDTDDVIRRFAGERQALAMLSSPNVAAVYDAGTTPDGRPWFAMEWVEGEPILEYCDDRAMSLRDRVELFIGACEGVQHAHQRGVIHRDIKSSNVLVSEQSGRPVPKIIDFGIAKAVAQEEDWRSVATAQGALLGTPSSMSPEQAGSGAPVDTRTDVYALGALLYELLAGAPPFEPERLAELGMLEARREIIERAPARPSAAAERAGDDAARDRGLDPAALSRRLRGDLDWIVLRALEKDPARRYDSVAQLAEDLRRHLHEQPVLAGPPSRVYRARKFIRRHRVGVIATGAVLLVAAAGAGGTVFNALRAAQRAELAAGTLAQLEEVFLSADPDRAGSEASLLEFLEAAGAQLDRRYAGEPAVEATWRLKIGTYYQRLSRFEEAERHLRRALELRERTDGPRAPATLAVRHQLGLLAIDTSDLDAAERMLRENLDARRTALGAEDPAYWESVNAVAEILLEREQLEEAERLARQSAEALRRLVGINDRRTIDALGHLGLAVKWQGRLEEAESIYREALGPTRALYGERGRDTLALMNNLARVLQDEGKFDEAEPWFRDTLRLRLETLGEEHADTTISMITLGRFLQERGEFEEAEAHLRRAVEIASRIFPEGHDYTAIFRGYWGSCLRDLERYDDAEPELRAALDALERSRGGADPRTLAAAEDLAILYDRTGRERDAGALRARMETPDGP